MSLADGEVGFPQQRRSQDVDHVEQQEQQPGVLSAQPAPAQTVVTQLTYAQAHRLSNQTKIRPTI